MYISSEMATAMPKPCGCSLHKPLFSGPGQYPRTKLLTMTVTISLLLLTKWFIKNAANDRNTFLVPSNYVPATVIVILGSSNTRVCVCVDQRTCSHKAA